MLASWTVCTRPFESISPLVAPLSQAAIDGPHTPQKPANHSCATVLPSLRRTKPASGTKAPGAPDSGLQILHLQHLWRHDALQYELRNAVALAHCGSGAKRTTSVWGRGSGDRHVQVQTYGGEHVGGDIGNFQNAEYTGA